MRPTFVSHFATCPNAAAHRRPAKVTKKQLGAIAAVSSRLGWSEEAVRDEVERRYSCALEELPRADASSFITDVLHAATAPAVATEPACERQVDLPAFRGGQ